MTSPQNQPGPNDDSRASPVPKEEDLAKYIVAAPSMQGNQPMSGETLNVQSFELAGEPVQ